MTTLQYATYINIHWWLIYVQNEYFNSWILFTWIDLNIISIRLHTHAHTCTIFFLFLTLRIQRYYLFTRPFYTNQMEYNFILYCPNNMNHTYMNKYAGNHEKKKCKRIFNKIAKVCMKEFSINFQWYIFLKREKMFMLLHHVKVRNGKETEIRINHR